MSLNITYRLSFSVNIYNWEKFDYICDKEVIDRTIILKTIMSTLTIANGTKRLKSSMDLRGRRALRITRPRCQCVTDLKWPCHRDRNIVYCYLLRTSLFFPNQYSFLFRLNILFSYYPTLPNNSKIDLVYLNTFKKKIKQLFI